jgi:hypothetical protein
MYVKVKDADYENALFKFRHEQLKLYTKVSNETFGQILKEYDVKRYRYRLYTQGIQTKQCDCHATT